MGKETGAAMIRPAGRVRRFARQFGDQRPRFKRRRIAKPARLAQHGGYVEPARRRDGVGSERLKEQRKASEKIRRKTNIQR